MIYCDITMVMNVIKDNIKIHESLCFEFAGFALECYVCLGQRTNKDKCIKTTIQCEKEQDACRTEIRWQRKYLQNRN
jgi:hypothetical protein